LKVRQGNKGDVWQRQGLKHLLTRRIEGNDVQVKAGAMLFQRIIQSQSPGEIARIKKRTKRKHWKVKEDR
ncbi:hypothetical protein BWI97_25310, partial [Siphonobacter sp. BAB-5405]